MQQSDLFGQPEEGSQPMREIVPVEVVAVETARPLADLATAINQAHAECERAMSAYLVNALEAGRLLNEAKGQLGHGAWLPWLRDNVSFSERTARNYMRLDRRREAVAEKSATVADLGVKAALEMLAEKPDAEPEESLPVETRRAPDLPAPTDGEEVSGAERSSGPLTMPAFRPGHSYWVWLSNPPVFGQLVPRSVELVPADAQGRYWRSAVLEVRKTGPEEDAWEGEYQFDPRGRLLADPATWARFSKGFTTSMPWIEEAPGYVPQCTFISTTGAAEQRMLRVTGGERRG